MYRASIVFTRELRTERATSLRKLSRTARGSRIEQGLTNPGWSTVEALASALDVTMTVVVQRVEKHG